LQSLPDAIRRAVHDPDESESAEPEKYDPAYVKGMERLVHVVQRLSLAKDLPAIMTIVRQAARELVGARKRPGVAHAV